ncbi:CLUMA_CG010627, isoform A [Clunio marinus]|uniref:CLUMA_CG010627, isoform A n=1 Tax=Clunio marinus TaxID=568069 RepID=A0A1J1IAB8_9DIPT|nr:CLUMA_CG010627, isoform A [Clunio marinus]
MKRTLSKNKIFNCEKHIYYCCSFVEKTMKGLRLRLRLRLNKINNDRPMNTIKNEYLVELVERALE